MLRGRVTWGHGSLVLNEHFNADGTTDESKVDDTIVLDGRRPNLTFRSSQEPYHLAQGGALGRVHKGFAVWDFTGRIRVPDATRVADLSDRERQVRAAFDPTLCLRDSPDTDGAYALDFSEPTADTATYPTGLIPLRIYGRPLGGPEISETLADGGSRPFSFRLLCPDPRQYAQAESSLVLTPASASGTITQKGNVPAPLKATIAMGGAGATNFTITRAGVQFVLNLSGCINGDSVVVVFETSAPYGRGRRITKNALEAFGLKTSTASTWLDVPVGATSVAISNHTNVTSCTLTYHDAWA